ncbi:MAG: DUF4019 domain-containing protein, partial [Rhodanobacteraceae bacterium]
VHAQTRIRIQKLDDPGSAIERRETQAVALAVLSEFDAMDYEAVWARTSTYLRSLISHSDWPKAISAYRSGMEKLRERTFDSFGFSDTLDGAPPARYALLTYRSNFGEQKGREKIVLVLEDGEWKLAGYFVRRPAGKR